MFCQAFYSIMILWSGVLRLSGQTRSTVIFRAFIYVMMFLSALGYVIRVTYRFSWSEPTLHLMNQITDLFLPSSQLLLGLLFLVYAIRFAKWNQGNKISATSTRTIRKLVYLGFIGFFTLIAKGIAKSIYYATANSLNNAPTWLASLIMLDFAALVGSVNIILVLGIGNVDAIKVSSAISNFRDSVLTIGSKRPDSMASNTVVGTPRASLDMGGKQ
jgi:hypothetical protein